MFIHTSGVIAVAPTDRSMLVRNRCVIEVLCCNVALLDFSVGVGALT